MNVSTDAQGLLSRLNPQQRLAATHGDGPLLIVAGAGTGKTATLAHRVAALIAGGTNPGRILLLTFTRRAAAEMLRRVEAILRDGPRESAPAAASRPSLAAKRVWGGTFHAIATRLLRLDGKSIGLDPGFTIHDRGDSEDLMGVLRTELKLETSKTRFPRKGTCMDIYSRAVNSQAPLETVLRTAFPWCKDHGAALQALFGAYVDRKEAQSVLDYDDLLLFWHGMLADSTTGEAVRNRFDCVLVDEYQDTNVLQAEILRLLRPDGRGLTVVGDDAQSIYSFRAATVRNILDFPEQFPGATIVALEQNYRSTEPILAATNRLIAQARERHAKDLWSGRTAGDRPALVICEDEDEQTDFLIRRILEHREAEIDLRRQAVLFRTSHHSMMLEAELARHNIPFRKFGGLKFVEMAHIKDLVAFLRLAENPRDAVAGTRVLVLLPGMGPKKAAQLMERLAAGGGNFGEWRDSKVPAATAELWPKLVAMLGDLAQSPKNLASQIHRVRDFFAPLLERKYDNAAVRIRDLEQLEEVAGHFADRTTFLAEMSLDPPSYTQDLAGPPVLDDDYLILSTIHSAKGLEWDAVYVIHAADGNIPSDMATGTAEEIDEERRLLYVAMTRAKNWLYVCFPLRYYTNRFGTTDKHGYAQLTRFLSPEVQACFDHRPARPAAPREAAPPDAGHETPPEPVTAKIRQRIKSMWS
jgi:DNA helicase II / ATP-dependent DNA helicase PcrA